MCSFLELPVPEIGQELNKIVAKINYFTSHIPDFLYTQPFYLFQNYKRNIKKDIKPLFKALLESTSKAILLVSIQSGVKRLIVTVVTNGKSISATMSVQYESIHYSIALYGRVLKSAEVNYAYETKLLLAVRDTINDNLPITSIYPITAISNVRHLVRNVHLPKIAFNTHQRLLTDFLPFEIIYEYTNSKEDIASLMIHANFSEGLPANVSALTCSTKAFNPFTSLLFTIKGLKDVFAKDPNAISLFKLVESSLLPSEEIELHSSIRSCLKEV